MTQRPTEAILLSGIMRPAGVCFLALRKGYHIYDLRFAQEKEKQRLTCHGVRIFETP